MTHGPRKFFAEFREILRMHGAAAALNVETRIASAARDEVFYVPFESVNADARLVLVGITPGPEQVRLAYKSAQALITEGKSDKAVLAEAKAANTFGGRSMRPNLLRLLRAFRFEALLGLSDAEELWGARADLLHATSVVPHAAFRKGKMFAGSFEEVLSSSPLRKCFEEDFVSSLKGLAKDAMFVALGPTPLVALDWSVREGYIQADQVLGAFPHPSSSSGSQVAVYLGEKEPNNLKPKDPVRHRLDFLLPAATRMRQAVETRLRRPIFASRLPLSPVGGRMAASASDVGANERVRKVGSADKGRNCTRLHYVVTRGSKVGTVLRPHVHEDGCIVVSHTRYKKDYIRLPVGTSPHAYLKRGFSLRMSAPGCAPSLISATSIQGLD